jgi:hypothetical protein
LLSPQAAPLSVAQRLSLLEARMTVVEQLRDEMRTGHVMIVTALTGQIEESRRHARVLHEDTVDRLRLIGERLTAHDDTFDVQDAKIDALVLKVDGIAETLAAHGETRAAHSQALASIEQKLPTRRRKAR